jgi:hypothetical protein
MTQSYLRILNLFSFLFLFFSLETGNLVGVGRSVVQVAVVLERSQAGARVHVRPLILFQFLFLILFQN